MALDQRSDQTVAIAIDERIRNVFDNLVKAHKLNMLPMDERHAKKTLRKLQKMRSAVSIKAHKSDTTYLPFHLQKCAMRQKWFDTAPEHWSTGYGTKEECEALFQVQYMSDEERLVDLESTFSSEYLRVSVPSWRSDDVSKRLFYVFAR